MLSRRKNNTTNYESASGEEEGIANLGDKSARDEEIHDKLADLRSCPFEIGGLKILSLGNIASCQLRITIYWTKREFVHSFKYFIMQLPLVVHLH